MLMTIDGSAAEPLYVQIRNQIVAGIATGALEPGQSLPSVRALASDLGINLHTVNKAYAVLRDEGYVTMRGRAGAVIADPAAKGTRGTEAAQAKMGDELFRLALAFRARGGTRAAFLEAAAAQAARAYGVTDRPAAVGSRGSDRSATTADAPADRPTTTADATADRSATASDSPERKARS